MADEPTVRGWLPPHAPGGQPPPRFDAAPEESPGPAAAEPAAAEWLPPTAAPAGGDAGWQAPAAGSRAGDSPGWQAPGAGPAPASPVDRSARVWGPPPDVTRPTAAQPAPAGALAITGVVLGALGLALLVLSLGTSFLLSLPCSAIGWACGAKARRRADEDPAGTRRGTAQTGVVLGMVGVGLGVVSAIVWIVLLSAGITIDDLRDFLERKLREQREQRGDGGLLAGLSVWLGR